MGDWALLWSYMRRQGWAIVVLAGVLLTGTVLTLIGPLVLRRFIDTVTGEFSTASVMYLALLFVVVSLGAQGFRAAEAAVAEFVAWRSTNQLRVDVLDHCIDLDMPFHHEQSPGELVERVDGDIGLLSNLFSRFVVTVVSQALLVVGVLVALTLVDWRLGALLAALTALGTVFLRRLAVWGRRAFVSLRETTGRLMGFVEERISAAEDLQVNGGVPETLRRLGELNRLLLRRDLRAAVVGSQLVWASTSVLISVATAVLLSVAAWLVGAEAMTIGTAYLVFAYTQQVQEPLIALSHQLQDYQRAMAGLTRVRELLSRTTEPQGGSRPLPASGPVAVAFDSVSFSYRPDAPTLSRVSFELPPGQSLGIAGHTGGGKTTIARLLVALYRANAGKVRVGGIDIAEVPLASLRDRVAMVTQEVHLFAGTVRDNVTMFDASVPDDVVHTAIDHLGLRPWLATLPAGLETILGERGDRLSAGQAQILALTRVFVRDPAVILLDEASARLDPLTESLLDQAMTPLLENRTAVIIAHRLSTLRQVDQILVLDRGQVVEYGARRDLVADPDSRFSSMLEAVR